MRYDSPIWKTQRNRVLPLAVPVECKMIKKRLRFGPVGNSQYHSIVCPSGEKVKILAIRLCKIIKRDTVIGNQLKSFGTCVAVVIKYFPAQCTSSTIWDFSHLSKNQLE